MSLSSESGWRKLTCRAAAGLAVCTLIGLFFSTQLYLVYSQLGSPIGFGDAVHFSFVNWYGWGLLAILVYGLARRFPLDGGRWWARLALHAGCAAGVALLHTALCVTWYWLVEARFRSTQTWWSAFERGLAIYFHWDVLIYAAILGFLHAMDYYRRLRDRELHASRLETQLNRARLDALRMQLNPHFLFNSLNALSELVYENPTLADRVITQLGGLLRAVLDETGKSEVTLREELEFVRKYLDIEQVRLGERLTVRIEAEPDTLDWRIPSLILQPLVENAVRHGIAPREEAGIIEVSASRSHGMLDLQVRNSGQAIAPQSESPAKGLGLANVRARLAQRYGEGFRLELSRTEAGGYSARILIAGEAAAPLGAVAPQSEAVNEPHSHLDCR